MKKCIVWRVGLFSFQGTWYLAVRNHLKGFLLSWNRRDVNGATQTSERFQWSFNWAVFSHVFPGIGWNLRVEIDVCCLIIEPKKMGCYKWRHFPKRSQWQPILFHKTQQIPYSEKAMAAVVHGYPSRPSNKTPGRNLTLILGWNVEVGKFFLGGMCLFSLVDLKFSTSSKIR